jgi:hypothetical protein
MHLVFFGKSGVTPLEVIWKKKLKLQIQEISDVLFVDKSNSK